MDVNVLCRAITRCDDGSRRACDPAGVVTQVRTRRRCELLQANVCRRAARSSGVWQRCRRRDTGVAHAADIERRLRLERTRLGSDGAQRLTSSLEPLLARASQAVRAGVLHLGAASPAIDRFMFPADLTVGVSTSG
jgi:hypothetical protein